MISPCSIKKELAKGQSLPEPKTVTTRAKAGSKRKKPSKPEEDSFEVERQIHEYVTERFVRQNAHQDKSLAKAKENLVAHAILQARIQIAQEAMDPGFERSAWDVAGWKQTLLKLGGDTGAGVGFGGWSEWGEGGDRR
ncbi:hypothetical protein Hanom_Chr09g00785091 [Helianthus anomalus]